MMRHLFSNSDELAQYLQDLCDKIAGFDVPGLASYEDAKCRFIDIATFYATLENTSEQTSLIMCRYLTIAWAEIDLEIRKLLLDSLKKASNRNRDVILAAWLDGYAE